MAECRMGVKGIIESIIVHAFGRTTRAGAMA